MNYEQYDVVLVDFSFSDETGSKKRPGLVISNRRYNRTRKEKIIAAITSNTDRVLFGDMLLKDWEEAGLRVPSLLTGIIRTVKDDMIVHKLGMLSKKDAKEASENLKKIALCSGIV